MILMKIGNWKKTKNKLPETDLGIMGYLTSLVLPP